MFLHAYCNTNVQATWVQAYRLNVKALCWECNVVPLDVADVYMYQWGNINTACTQLITRCKSNVKTYSIVLAANIGTSWYQTLDHSDKRFLCCQVQWSLSFLQHINLDSLNHTHCGMQVRQKQLHVANIFKLALLQCIHNCRNAASSPMHCYVHYTWTNLYSAHTHKFPWANLKLRCVWFDNYYNYITLLIN